MKTTNVVVRAAAVALGLFVAAVAVAQDAQTADFTGRSFTPEELIAALDLQTREVTARCAPFQDMMTAQLATRGIGFTPTSAAEVPALKTAKSVNVTVTFGLNSDQLTDAAKANLNQVSVALTSAELRTQCFQLAGHTCDLGSDSTNFELSGRRAAAVKEYLVSRGVEAERLVTTGFGETSPLVANESEALRARNRRVEVGALSPVALQYK
jgi:outer membrane protein OmpA-like peptidoglycan-associated protein